MELYRSIRTLLALAFLLAPVSAFAQCNGVFPPNTLCGNLSGSSAPPGPFTSAGTIAGPGSSTLNGLPIWASTLGTQLKDANGLTIAGNYTWGGTQTYSAAQTFNALVNFTSTFQIGGQTFTWPAAGTTVAGLGTNNSFSGNNTFSGTDTFQTGTKTFSSTTNFTGTFQVGGNTMTFPAVSTTLPGICCVNTWASPQVFNGGSASGAAFSTSSNTVQTSPVAGGYEYDGNVGYFTPNSGNRGVIPATMILTLSANQTGTNVLTAQPWFPGGGATGLNVAANTTYLLEGHLSIGRTVGGTSHTTSLLFGGTATITSINFVTRSLVTVASGTAQTLGTAQLNEGSGTVAITSGIASSTEFITAEVRGLVRVNAAGTFIPQFIYSAAPGGAPTVQANSWFSMTPIGNGSVLSVGNWQ